MGSETPKECNREHSNLKLSVDSETEDVLAETRRIFLIGEIDDGTSFYINSYLQAYACYDSKKPVFIYISSPGGDLAAGYSIVDQILLSPFKVYTIIQGQANSMAAIIAAYGTKGCRFITKNSTVMIHSMLVLSKFESIESHKTTINYLYKEYVDKVKDLAKRTKVGWKELFELMEKTYWMNAKQATTIGIVDGIWTPKLEQQLNKLGKKK